MHIEVSYQLTADELRRGLNGAFAGRRLNGWLLTATFVAEAAVAAIVNTGILPALLLFLALVYGVRQVFVTWFAPRRRAPRVCVPTTVVLTESMTTCRTELTYSELRWGAYIEVRDLPDFIALFRTKRAVALIPKRAFDVRALGELNAFFAYHAIMRGAAAAAALAPVDNPVA